MWQPSVGCLGIERWAQKQERDKRCVLCIRWASRRTGRGVGESICCWCNESAPSHLTHSHHYPSLIGDVPPRSSWGCSSQIEGGGDDEQCGGKGPGRTRAESTTLCTDDLTSHMMAVDPALGEKKMQSCCWIARRKKMKMKRCAAANSFSLNALFMREKTRVWQGGLCDEESLGAKRCIGAKTSVTLHPCNMFEFFVRPTGLTFRHVAFQCLADFFCA